MIYDLPTSVAFGGREWAIRTDYREVLRVLAAFEDPNLTAGERVCVCLWDLYPDFGEIPPEQLQAAYDAAVAFIDQRTGGEPERVPGPRTMDWAQDAPLIFPAVNRAAGFEVRAVGYLHWWTFLGYFMEIRGSACATVLALRQKKYGRHKKKLEKHEQEFWDGNRALCELRPRYSDAELEERRRAEEIVRVEKSVEC